MGLQKFVKISGVSNLSDARYCAGMMVDILGFNVDPDSEDYISPDNFKDITGWLSGIRTCGEFGDKDFKTIQQNLSEYEFDMIETQRFDLLKEIKTLGKPIIFKIEITDGNLDELSHLVNLQEVSYLVISLNDLNLLPNVRPFTELRSDLILEADIDQKSVLDIGSDWHGIQLKGTPEDQPGFKDYGIIMDVLEALETD